MIEGKDPMSGRIKRCSLSVLSREWLCRAPRERAMDTRALDLDKGPDKGPHSLLAVRHSTFKELDGLG